MPAITTVYQNLGFGCAKAGLALERTETKMSYAGTYGEDETCSHGSYWKSCGYGCSLVGPRATAAQIAAARTRREQESAGRQQAELELRAMYDNLNDDERIAAEALWGMILGSYPGLGKLELRDAVQGRAESIWIGKARSCCNQAKIVVTALEAARTKA